MNLFHGFLDFNRGLLRVRSAVQLWVLWLILVNVVAATYFMPRIEAKVVIVSFTLGAIAMCALTASKGFTRILGLGHIFWLPMMAYLISRLPQLDLSTLFGQWIVVLLISNVVALLFDVVDVRRYWQGDRAPMAEVS